MRGMRAHLGVRIPSQALLKTVSVRPDNYPNRAKESHVKNTQTFRSSTRQIRTTRRNGESFSRRSLLKSAVGAAVGRDRRGFCRFDRHARAGAGTLYLQRTARKFPCPIGSLTYLDKKQYIHNMEIISHISGAIDQRRRTAHGHVGQRQAATVARRRRFCRHQRGQESGRC